MDAPNSPDSEMDTEVDSETKRLAALRECDVLDTDAEDRYEDIVRLAAHLCGAPIAAVTLVDADRQFFKSILGLDVRQTPRAVSFCAHTILQKDVLIVPDATRDPRFADNPLVTGDTGLRFYAGAPLVTEDGHALGSLCVVDRVPRALTPDQAEALAVLARLASAQLESARRAAARERLTVARERAEAANREAARATQEAARRHRAIMDTAPDPIVLVDGGGRISDWNTAAERALGWTTAEAVGRDFFEAVSLPAFRAAHPGGLAQFLASDAGAAATRRMEVSVRRRDGGEFPAELTVVSMTEAGRPAFKVNLRDITAQKRTEAALQKEQEFTRALLESLQEGIVACDAAGEITLYNRAVREFHALPDAPLPPDQWAEFFDLYAADGLTPMRGEELPLFRALRGEVVRGVEMVIAPPAGPRRTVQADGQPIYGPDGAKLGAVVAMQDITERRQAEQEMGRLAALVESSEEAILGVTLDGTLVNWNAGAERLYGYTASEVIGRHKSVLAPVEESDVMRTLLPLARRGEALPSRETRRRRKDGVWVDVSQSYSPIRNAAGETVGVACIARDVTAQKRAEAALAESNARVLESEARLRRLSDAAFEGIAITRDGVVVDGNSAFAALFGYADAAEMVGLLGETFAAPESRHLAVRKIADNDETPYEATLQRRDGSTFLAELRGRQTQIEGRPARITALRDITAYKEAQARLRESQARLAKAQRIARVGSWDLDLGDGRVSWSDQMFSLLGCDPALGPPTYEGILTLYHPEDAATLRALVTRAAQEGVGYELDLRGRPDSLGDGLTRWYHSTGEVITDAAGRPARLTGTLADITERKAAEARLRESEQRLALATRSARIGIWDWDAAADRMLWDAQMHEFYGLRAEDFSGAYTDWQRLIHPEDRARVEAEIVAALEGSGDFHSRFRIVRPDGDVRHTEAHAVVLRTDDSHLMRMVGVNWDITERTASEERFRVLFEQSSDPHLLFDEGGIIDCNPAAVALLGYREKAAVLGLHPAALSPEFQPDGKRSAEKCLEMDALALKHGRHRFEWLHRKVDGTEFPVEVTLTPVTLAERPVLLVVWHDLTERKRAEEAIRDYAVLLEYQKQQLEEANAQLEDLATTDGLTGLKNHRTFQERLAEEVSRAARYGPPLSLVLLDVDHFKQYNDAYGHPAGDEVLRRVAHVLQDGARETDVVARYGGEEFALILPQTDGAGARVIAERLRAAIAGAAWPTRAVTASLGVATLGLTDDGGGSALLARADAALYAAKRAGRNQVAGAADAPAGAA